MATQTAKPHGSRTAGGNSGLSFPTWMGVLLLVVTTAAIYSNVLDAPFVFDDTFHLIEKVRRGDAAGAQAYTPAGARGLVNLTFALNQRWGGLDVFGYHLVNVAVHAINGILVYFLASALLQLLSRLPGRATGAAGVVRDIPLVSLFCALFFIAHPIQTQAVTYTVQRYTSMAAMFYFGALLAFLRARMIVAQSRVSGDLSRGKQVVIILLYVACAASAVAAMFCKQNAASLPAAMLLIEYLFVDRSASGWKKKSGWIAVGLGAWTLLATVSAGLFRANPGNLAPAGGVVGAPSRWQYLCTQFTVIVHYLRMLVLPLRQNADPYYPLKAGFLDGVTPLAFLFLVFLIVWAVIRYRRHPVFSFCILWFFVALSVESSFIPLRNTMFEHRLYLPMFGFALGLAYFPLKNWSRRRFLVVAILAVIAAELGTASFLRNRAWRDPVTFWRDAVRKNPANPRAHNNLGFALFAMDKHGKALEAMNHFNIALGLDADYWQAHLNRGNAMAAAGQLAPAGNEFRETLRIRPNNAKAHNNMANVLSQMGRTGDAIEHYRKSLSIDPQHPSARFNLGNLLSEEGNTPEAMHQYTESLRLHPGDARTHINLGVLLARTGRHSDASYHYRQAAKLEPDMAEPYYNLACLDAMAGRIGPAIRWLEKAVSHGFDNVDFLVEDEDLAGISNSPEFEAFVRKHWEEKMEN
ncbi:MAG: tetratricopeptide repeat protein [Lentisphaerae bacterium]|nr:tetratricopeptide repeat protein [Lentisphaerota bacterium]